MIKIYPKNYNVNYKVNFGEGSISPKAAQEFIDGYERIERAVDTVGNDPHYKSLASKLSKTTREGVPKNAATPEQLAIMQDKVDKLIGKDGLKDQLSKIGSKFKNEGNVPADHVPKFVENIFKKWSNSETIKYLSRKGPKGIAIALAAGNVGKELVGTTVYTIQALTNEDLPVDKRKFIGMYDLVVGLISTTFSAIFGFGAIAVQDKLIQKALKKNSGKGFPKYAGAYAGLVWLIPQLLQTIIGKRIVAPAIATPLAGKMKANMIAKAEAKKTKISNAYINDDNNANKTDGIAKGKADEQNNAVDVKFVSLNSYVDNAQSVRKSA